MEIQVNYVKYYTTNVFRGTNSNVYQTDETTYLVSWLLNPAFVSLIELTALGMYF